MNRNVCHADWTTPQDYNHSFPFEQMHYLVVNNFMTAHFSKAWMLTFVYVLVIHAGQHYMKDRPPYKLKTVLLFWNLFLALYSIVALVRVGREMLSVTLKYGFHDSICHLNTVEHKNFLGFWTAAFAFSKVLELGDTAFIVLRKTPLIFLHWYHHVATLLFVWYSCVNVSSIGRWFQVMNLFVHSIMYSYYALKVLNIKVPHKVSMGITSLQLLQMVVGIFLSVYAYRMRLKDVPCCANSSMIFYAWTMYLSYFLLFLNFFIRSYGRSKQSGAKASAKKLNRKVQ